VRQWKEKVSSDLLPSHVRLWKEKEASCLLPSQAGERKEKEASRLITSGGWEGNSASILFPSLDGRGWGRVILEHRDLSQKLGKNYIHHNTGGLTINKNNFFAGGKETQCY
jgi:hypothetical protein